MKTVTAFPCRVREIENNWITLSDGCRLAARIWLPDDAEAEPVPAILEYLPYRKRDGTAERDQLTHPYFAGHGYASVRVDMRGCGESDGLLHDEYLKQEQDDCLEVLRWIAAQPWCTGKVGMIGISWGGFNGLQVAARRPPELKAVITLCSTDDRYADDIHYMGGCLLTDNLAWASTMLAYSSRPPDPAIVGERWREMWLNRLEREPLLIETWLRHQRRDAYWKHGSVCEDYGAIECPVYAVGGWADGYSNAIPRLLAGLKVPRKGLIGPWAHKYPHFAKPGPQIGFLQECLRWWDQWLKGIDTGIMAEPMYRVWMQDCVPPQANYAERPGRWVAEPAWPSARIKTRTLLLADGALQDCAAAEQLSLRIRSPLAAGLASGRWCPHGTGPDHATDQREDDGNSLVFDSPPIAERLEVLGAPVVELELAADRPAGMVCARLCDVAPDGTSARVSYGLLNLAHRDGHENPRPLDPGKRYRVRIQLNDIAHAFPVGHHIRLALSTGYWPVAWPSPSATTLEVLTGASRLDLPVRPPQADDAALPPFPLPEAAATARRRILKQARDERRWRWNMATGESHLVQINHDGAVRFEPHGLETEGGRRIDYGIGVDDPGTACMEVAWTVGLARGDWQVRTETRTVMRSTEQEFLLEATLDAYEGDARILSRTWSSRIPRDGV